MPTIIVSIDGAVIKELQLIKERTTIGRRPYNDIVIENLAISGEHAVLHAIGHMVEVEDLGSTNGTYVNGILVKRQQLYNGDVVDVGKYKIRFLDEAEGEDFEKTMVFRSGMVVPAVVPPPGAVAVAVSAPPVAAQTSAGAVIRVLSGAATGREVALTKVVTTIGKPGVAVASVTRRPHGYVLAHVEGADMPSLNGVHIGSAAEPIKNGDRIRLAGTEMQFVQS